MLRNAGRALASQRRDSHSGHRLAIVTQAPVARRHQHFADAVGVLRLHLEDPRVIGAGGLVGALHQIHTLRQTGFMRSLQHGIKIMFAGFLKPRPHNGGGALGDARRHARGLADLFGAEIVAVGIAGAFSRENTHAHAQFHALGGALDDALVHADGTGREVLEIEVGVVAAGGKRLA